MQLWFCLLVTLLLIGPIAVAVNHFGNVPEKNRKHENSVPETNMEPDRVHTSYDEHDNNSHLTAHERIPPDDVSGNHACFSSRATPPPWLLTPLPYAYFNLFSTLVTQENKRPSKNMAITFLFSFWYIFGLVVDCK